MEFIKPNRRNFLKSSLMSGIAMSAMNFPLSSFAETGENQKPTQVALTHGDDHIDNIFKGLSFFKDEIKKSIGNKQVILKPNNVSIDQQLAATHANSLAATLEFLKSIGVNNIIIAESAASGSTLEGFNNFGYEKVASKYGVKLVDLDKMPYEMKYVVSDEDFRPKAVRTSALLLDRKNNFVISNAVMKTHDRVIATLSLKNVVFGAPIKDEGFGWGPKSKKGAKNDKPVAHGGGTRGINYNLFQMASKLHPDLSVIDGFKGMEGDGPVGGTPVDHKIAVVSQDWLAADRVGIELMGIDFAKVGWMNYCSDAKMGQTDLAKMEILGGKIADHKKQYKLSSMIEGQLIWDKPMKITTG